MPMRHKLGEEGDRQLSNNYTGRGRGEAGGRYFLLDRRKYEDTMYIVRGPRFRWKITGMHH